MFTILISIFITIFSFIAGIAYVPMHSILSMLLTYLCAGLLFMYLGLEFMGLIYIVVYAGAIVILFIFILMLTNQPYKERASSGFFSSLLFYAAVLFTFIAILFISTLFGSDSNFPKRTEYSDFMKDSDLAAIASYLYDSAFLYVLVIAVVLFIALVSVVITTNHYKATYASKRELKKVYKILN